MSILFKKFGLAYKNGHYKGTVTGVVYPFYGIPVYVPAGSARELRRCKKLMKRAASLSERLSDALSELSDLKAFNERKFSCSENGKEPPIQAAPDDV